MSRTSIPDPQTLSRGKWEKYKGRRAALPNLFAFAMDSLFIFLYFVSLSASVVAQSSVVCVAGQCLQGISNTTFGVKLSGTAGSVLLLPGQYTSTTNPQLVHSLLTSPSASLSNSAGFNSSTTVSLPLNINLEPGIAVYAQSKYSGQAAFSSLPTSPLGNISTPLAANSLVLADNVWAIVSSSSSDNRVVLWDSVPDISQLPSGTSQSLSLVDLQSTACSPPCSGSSVCSASGTCICPAGFTGSSCESCADGFFGPTCQPCPSGCTSCDQGISGSGRCLTPAVPNAPSTCSCLNGQCGSNGQCTCNPGWVANTNGTACAKCAPGFFLTSTGDCKVCQLGCTSCADTTGTCISCDEGLTQDANDGTKCSPLTPKTSAGNVCPDGSFVNGASCSLCSPSCQTCSGPSSNDCIICASGQFRLNGNCVGTDSNGVCQGSNGMVADNVKKECDTCGAKCTSCRIPNFTLASTFDQAQCTDCLPGFVLSEGKCVASCPTGSFVSPQDNLTCTACSSTCGTCVGAADFCLTCKPGQLASSGQCVSTCPSNTFASSGSCIKCHPDCASCSGPSFNQCSTCPPDRPVLTNGRCLPTCAKAQFFDPTTSSCQACDSSCSSCSGAGPSNCLACASTTQVLRGGSCVSANCNGASNVVPGLGVCLSELVQAPSRTDPNAPPLPSISGLGDPTVINTRRPLAWWQILLMALGCAFIFVVIVMLWRRRAKKQRAKRTAMFAAAKKIDRPGRWRDRLVRFGERFFGHRDRLHKMRGAQRDADMLPVAYNHHDRHLANSRPQSLASYRQDIKLKPILVTRKPAPPVQNEQSKKKRDSNDSDSLLDAYAYSTRSRSSYSPSSLPGLDDRHQYRQRSRERRIEHDSLYAEVTGVRRNTPEPRQPLKRDVSGLSRLSNNTVDTYANRREVSTKEGVLVDIGEERSTPAFPLQMTVPLSSTNTGASSSNHNLLYNLGMPVTEAQAYAMANRPALGTNLSPPVLGPAMTGGGGSVMPIPIHLGPGSNMTPGSYWLTPVAPLPTGTPQQQQQDPYPSVDTVVLQPMMTGTSSRNPFRQGHF
ncbi:Furin-like protease 2 [Psilocybe cubensis]|uniref:Furin-like protease 2 n=2 Tax=Psilocybe cubensis TaxID=181762 RepID=A0ACB8H7J7_PSICU|nr:Furin-like protease 2 [Psilocybe cubensis]KAH9483647.1 Furin-like protease 2 [Psilocybe cubensis]